jgi:Transcription-silencing protein, cryptic loci regulator Clr2
VRFQNLTGFSVWLKMLCAAIIDGPEYVLKSFPAGYKLFDHHKGPAPDPRHDLYLFGVISFTSCCEGQLIPFLFRIK